MLRQDTPDPELCRALRGRKVAEVGWRNVLNSHTTNRKDKRLTQQNKQISDPTAAHANPVHWRRGLLDFAIDVPSRAIALKVEKRRTTYPIQLLVP